MPGKIAVSICSLIRTVFLINAPAYIFLLFRYSRAEYFIVPQICGNQFYVELQCLLKKFFFYTPEDHLGQAAFQKIAAAPQDILCNK